MDLNKILYKDDFSAEEIEYLLSLSNIDEVEQLRLRAYEVMKQYCGEYVSARGLVEFSNYCVNDCYYCGIRKSNQTVSRYLLSKDDILKAAHRIVEYGYGSMVLQSGDRNDKEFIDFVVDIVKEIKSQTRSEQLPEGLGVTLCVGEQTLETYKKFYEAGAHRYLLRIETTNPELFKQIHPKEQTLESRKHALSLIKQAGFQVGTGVMIAIPGQTLRDLANDILFFKHYDIDMLGMGPYLTTTNTPMEKFADACQKNHDYTLRLALNMISVSRIVLKDVNIASTTALQAMDDEGREKGLLHGANVIMPQMTPMYVRKEYQLYDGKPCLEDSVEHCSNCIKFRVISTGREIAMNDWGDSKHFTKNHKHA